MRILHLVGWRAGVRKLRMWAIPKNVLRWSLGAAIICLLVVSSILTVPGCGEDPKGEKSRVTYTSRDGKYTVTVITHNDGSTEEIREKK